MIINPPFAGLIHNISKNQMRYIKMKYSEFDLNHDVRYLMLIYDNQNVSQDELVEISGQSKGNIAKTLKKLEDKDLITREVNPENRRKYMLKTTEKGSELVPKIRQISKDWEMEVGISDLDEDFKKRLKEIAIKSAEITR